MESQATLPCLQKLPSGPYPEPRESLPYLSILCKTHLNIILAPICRSSHWSRSFWLSQQNDTCIHFYPFVLHDLPSYSSWLHDFNYAWWRVHAIKLPIMQPSAISRHFIPLRSKYSPQHPVHKQPQSMFLSQLRENNMILQLYSCTVILPLIGLSGTTYGPDDRGIGVPVPVGSRIFTSPYLPDRLWGLLSLLSTGYRGHFPLG
jgi:hypothetical protein